MVDFAGWEMPILYTSILEEHHHTRSKIGLFDVSHMGRLRFRGADSARFLERACTRRVSDMAPGQARYSLVCNEKGGVRDDVLVYRLEGEEFMLVVNASNREKIVEHFGGLMKDLRCSMEDHTFDTAMVALQGPQAIPLIANFSQDIPALKRYRFTTVDVFGADVIVSRTGYTGEDGVEAVLPASAAAAALEVLTQIPGGEVIKPAGLGARDTLRMEASMPLYGHELGEDTPALASGLDFAVGLDKDQFPPKEPFHGMKELRKQRDAGTARRLVGLSVEGKRAARQGMKVLDAGREVGEVTSGCVSPTLGRSIAMAYVDSPVAGAARPLTIDTGKGSAMQATITPMPFYKAPK
jgi:aminomethyltransferase